ncbi:LuxR C-terminal-related transcriptional regulator [Flavobacterium psychrotolerans]|uniref:HTH luxR-type domain-containing protein n=1 Tax=Flavobacterium psychrotolerans TaxID=2169410 RepID=A0A2U1JKS9_9FLAO|nr:LuxR C-terminal-related transcriptional regulator [Flavobacterium psychrotolerans]PWA05584.1 hypothetical protein DB895_06260 [Flavobacterium psychrotolerans]
MNTTDISKNKQVQEGKLKQKFVVLTENDLLVVNGENKGIKLSENLEFEIQAHIKQRNVFQVGDFYCVVLDNHSGKFIYVSEHTEEILGVKPEDVTIKVLLRRIHPEDLSHFMNYTHAIAAFFKNLPAEKIAKYKSRFDYRVQKSNGQYMRILQQDIVLEHDDDGDILKSLSSHIDVSHLKGSGKPLLSIIGIAGEPSYIDIDVEQKYSISSFLSKREKQVVNLLINGKVSKEIAEELSLSVYTIESYRKDMLKKTGAITTCELVAKVIREGWI